MRNRGFATRRRRRADSANEEQLREKRHACSHALLNRPWVEKEKDPELYYWIKDMQEELRIWFLDFTGFPLIVTRTMAKLDKTPVIPQSWMGFREFGEPRDYMFFTYGLWFLESKTEHDQFLLTNLIDEMTEQLKANDIAVDWTEYRNRLSLARALKKLKELGVLRSLDGEEDSWAARYKEGADNYNILYESSPYARYILRQLPRELFAYDTLESLSDPMLYPETEAGESVRRRHRVYRRLLLEPAVADCDWSDEDRYYVGTQRHTIIDNMDRMFGFVGRRYKEGLLFFYPELTGEEELFPTQSGLSDIALLLGGIVRDRLDAGDAALYLDTDGIVWLERSGLEHLLLEISEEHKSKWAQELRSGPVGKLAEMVTSFLLHWGLAKTEPGSARIGICPVLGRWRGKYMTDVMN
ncbi:TIGR02678 family protein [Paenibacillus sp. MZ04-78.2]|uniref:TIGR02678 family protein n=1 Tax=Paenibacillus sp. MZ04-78.2 TaxID=2962034 RepID=UPI0020B6CD45|nr:TIGR02678 family protein [Paenibacillus sp. MZ04-78.2]MCP3776015.1 TIGR02678 family protein [Paenibacillus sp. MZ04-78.2]